MGQIFSTIALACMCATQHAVEVRGQLGEISFLFHSVGPRYQTQAVKLGHLYHRDILLALKEYLASDPCLVGPQDHILLVSLCLAPSLVTLQAEPC